ncbi:hypothetical protein NCS55_00496700 [Fusarium keratoplasticum]|nr:hypothetical protein NCS55_00496700 [Fusarium keratoplasticum]
MMSDTSQPATECEASTLDNLPPLSVLLKALKPGTNIFNTRDYSPDCDDESDELIELGCGSLSYILHEPGQSFVIKKQHSGFNSLNCGLVRLTGKEADMTMNAFQVFSKLETGRHSGRIGINVVDLLRAIGEAFAVIHFDCGLSGMGVEFAFGLSIPKRPCAHCLYTVDLYLFDLGYCWKEDNRVGTEGLNMADNMLEPEARKFIPNPLNSPTLYKVFKDAYIEHAKKSLGDECSPLPCNVMKHY